MKKLHSVLLSAAVALMAVFSVKGAPLASSELPLQKNDRVATLPASVWPTTTDVYSGKLHMPRTSAEVARARAEGSATAARRAMDASLDLRGWIAWPQNMLGLYILPKTDTESFTSFGNNAYGVINGGGYDDGRGSYHGVYYQAGSGSVVDIKIFHFDSETFDITDITQLDAGENLGVIAMDIDLDPTTGIVYGCYMTDDGRGYCWGFADYNTGVRTKIADLDLEHALVAVASDSQGQFYGLTRQAVLVKINKSTGAQETVGNTNVPYLGYLAGYAAGAAMDRNTNKMYVTYLTPDDISGVYEIDPATGASAPAVTFKNPAMVLAPFFYAGNTAGKTPMAPGLTVSAPEGTMTVIYTVTLPTTLEDGTPITGLVNWEVYCEGELIDTGANMAGASASGTVTRTTSGLTHFSAITSNNAGKSLPAEASLFVGKGVPATPADFSTSWADGTMTLSWDAVTASADGGYINPAQVTYTVTVNGEQLADNLTATSYSYPLPVPDDRTSYVYGVTAVYSGIVSAEAKADPFWLGAFAAPLDFDFTPLSYGAVPDGFTVIDANGDGKTWGGYGSGRGLRYYYNMSKAADDWLISPDVKMEAGKVYAFEIFVSSYNNSDDERVEVKAGMGSTAEAMTLDVIPATKVLDSKGFMLTGIVAPTESGSWNVGVHAISDANKYYLFLKEMHIGAGVDPQTPAVVSAIALTPEVSGLLQVAGSFTLPIDNVVGQPLTGDVTVKVTRGDVEIATLTGAPGATLTFADNNVPAKGDYTYTVTTLYNGVDGVSASASAFVGPYAAVAPASVTAFESYQPGTVTLMWDKVAADINGTALNAANVTYMVYSVEEGEELNTIVTPLLDAPIAANNATVNALEDASTQKFLQFAVSAFNRDAESETCVTDLIPVGKPYKLPVTYTGSKTLGTYIERISNKGTGFWDIYTPDQIADGPAPVASEDFYGCYAGASELYGDLYTGKIDLTEAERPEVSFFTYKFPDNHKNFVGEDVNFIEVIALVNNKMTLVGRASHSEMTAGLWNTARFDLSEFKGKNIQVIFRAIAKSGNYTLLDEAVIKETPANDLVALSLQAPAQVGINSNFSIAATIGNHGYKDASNFTVVLYRDGEEVDSRPVQSLAAGEELTLLFDHAISYFDEDSSRGSFTVEIVYDIDNEPENNVSSEITVLRPLSAMPAVSDLAGEVTEQGNKLYWTKYTVDALTPVEITEDFEEADAWEHSYGDWTFITESTSTAGRAYGYEFPGIESYETVCSWFVVNNLGAEDDLPAHSGNQYICSWLKSDGKPNNDWAISPLLSGQAQTVSFYAKGLRGSYPEKFEFYYTTLDSTNPADYVQMGDVRTPDTYDWERFEYSLPEGAKHFAVKCVSADCYFLVLDDFTFTPDPLAGAPALKGYDVYRDGQKLNSSLIADSEYLDTEAGDSHTYHVVGSFDKGDSELSNPLRLERSDLDAVSAADGVRVYAEGQEIVVEGAAGKRVAINTVDGRTLYSGEGSCRMGVAPAIYLVTVGEATTKLIVR